MQSLRGKITAGYYAFAIVIGGISLFAYLDLEYVEHQIHRSEVVSRMNEVGHEMRRYEKNFLLYRDRASLEQAHANADSALALLNDESIAFAAVASSGEREQLAELLGQYQRQLDRLVASNDGAEQIRQRGHDISTLLTTLAERDFAQLRLGVSESRNALLYSIALIALLGVWLGRRLSRMVVEPLQQVEQELAAIADGRFDSLSTDSRDQEIVSFARAVNRMLDELDSRRRQLLHSEKLASLGVLVSGVAHELNNPLSNISTSAQLSLEELGSADKEQLRQWLGQIDEQTERARGIVRALLDFARDKPFRIDRVNLREIVDKSVTLLRNEIKRQVDVTTDIDPALMVAADPQRMQQVFINLIKNAADSSDQRIHVRIESSEVRRSALRLATDAHVYGNEQRRLDSDQMVAVITVTDNGPGIPAAILPKIFDPFFTTRETGHGMGLGLYVVMEIIEDHDGCIAVESAEGEGTCFTIVLPVVSDVGDGAR